MTDEQIIKALGYCKRDAYYTRCNSNCPLRDYCESDEEDEMNICGLTLALIDRQNAEIERLHRVHEAEVKRIYNNNKALMQYYRGEVIKEFTERLKEELRLEENCDYDCENCCYECKEYIPEIDSLVKEMTEGENNT